MYKIEKLVDFYNLMFETKNYRRKIVRQYFDDKQVDEKLIKFLSDAENALEHIPRLNDQYVLKHENKDISLDLTYEINELKKDLFFLKHSEQEFISYLESAHENFPEQVSKGLEFLKGLNVNNFITDRDGTVNNYCGRYQSSIQSVYNSVFITRFARSVKNASIIMTSAPLVNIGLVDISINPEQVFIYAGSKGREYFDKQGRRKQLPIEPEKQGKLSILNAELEKLVKKPQYEMFSLIGSGLQYKFGQTTIARQDMHGSIPEEESLSFLEVVSRLVKKIDPQNRFFRIEDTGKDIEIILTIGSGQAKEGLKDFDKGDGVEFLDRELALQLNEGVPLVCGDTASDVPMVQASMEKNKETRAIFVTMDENLKNKVKTVCPNSFFVSSPDILISILNNKGKRM